MLFDFKVLRELSMIKKRSLEGHWLPIKYKSLGQWQSFGTEEVEGKSEAKVESATGSPSVLCV
jgi:hypothetical protein